ncbi:MAG TPA: histidine kinase dimerization/phospho-acceptor domain-containing protein, partial [Bacteroidota bacterium]|nr:histidine kinase dimerization/phospho-acceptor domain-containing protein [Bacteroidota bacterium]
MNLQAFYLNAVQSKKAVLALGAAGVALIGVVDYATGPDVGATIMYLIPLMFATWYAGWYAGVAISVTAGVVWFFAMYLWRAGEESYAWLYWNALMRIGIFLVIARLLHNFKTLKEGLEQEVEKRTEALRRELARRSELERSLVESERTYKDLVENAMVGVFKSNVWGEILYVNPAMVKMFEYDSAEEMMARNALAHYANVTDRERFIEELTRAGKVANFELRLLTKYQRTKVVQVSATLEGDIISGMVRDVTTLKALEKRLTEVDRLESLGTLAGGIAHDFNNILGIILGHAALVGRFNDRPDRVRRAAEAIISASQRGSGLVRQLLTFARKADVVLDTVHINTVVHDVAHLLSETFPKNITITTHLATGLPLLTADLNQLHQVLINLCVNARDAMGSGGTLTLRTQLMSGDEVRAKFPTAQA